MLRIVPLLVLGACDDHLFPSVAVEAGACEPTWSGMEAIFVAHCDSCHPAVSSPDLHADISAEAAAGGGAYLLPGDPEGSLLYQVFEGVDAILMPFGATEPLPEETRACVYDWIANGAVVE